jgi:hypothetical protein
MRKFTLDFPSKLNEGFSYYQPLLVVGFLTIFNILKVSGPNDSFVLSILQFFFVEYLIAISKKFTFIFITPLFYQS